MRSNTTQTTGSNSGMITGLPALAPFERRRSRILFLLLSDERLQSFAHLWAAKRLGKLLGPESDAPIIETRHYCEQPFKYAISLPRKATSFMIIRSSIVGTFTLKPLTSIVQARSILSCSKQREARRRIYPRRPGSLCALTTERGYVERRSIGVANARRKTIIGAAIQEPFPVFTLQPDDRSNILRHTGGTEQSHRYAANDCVKRHNNLVGFEEYLSRAETAPADSRAAKKLAPSFRMTSLDGKEFDLAAPRGKVVVLNFWFINCAPCRVEIPGLNRLVDQFKDQDVVFLAPALDDEKALRAFLRETEFKYQILPGAGQVVVGQYGVTSYPTHVIINREGQIEAFLTGGSEDRHNDLRPLIERALGK